ncbi:MAG: carbohydrate kinase family protein [Cytophagia bacterium]|nr:carbohydrate kinase family protein [Cytophagia bacterium]
MKYDLALVADLCIDLLFAAKVKPVYGQVEQFMDDYRIELGGSASIFASQFTKLGGKAAFLGVYGNDGFGDFLRNRMKELNMDDLFLIQSEVDQTAVGLGLGYYDDRAMLTYKGSMENINSKLVESSAVLHAASHVHINSYYLLEHLQEYWIEKAPVLQRQRKTISLDTNWSLNGDWEKVHDLLPYVDVFLPNEEEAKLISKRDSIDEAGRMLNEICPIVVIKRGADGASVFQDGAVTHFPIPQTLIKGLIIKDTTGAGDNFCSGFIFNWLKKEPIENCVELGLKCGTSSLKEIGGIKGQFVP